MGEVGSALSDVVGHWYETYVKDIGDEYGKVSENGKAIIWGRETPRDIEIMHVCLNYSPAWFDIVDSYVDIHRPKIINIQTTVPPGTTRMLADKVGTNCVHSTTRGLHPNLAESMRTFVKFIGCEDDETGNAVASYFEDCGVVTKVCRNSRTTELAHILSNALYGANIMFAAEMDKLCRKHGVDWNEAVTAYTNTSNEGYRDLGHESKMRFVLTPPSGRIGGHCVVYAANMIPAEDRGPIMKLLAGYNDLA